MNEKVKKIMDMLRLIPSSDIPLHITVEFAGTEIRLYIRGKHTSVKGNSVEEALATLKTFVKNCLYETYTTEQNRLVEIKRVLDEE